MKNRQVRSPGQPGEPPAAVQRLLFLYLVGELLLAFARTSGAFVRLRSALSRSACHLVVRLEHIRAADGTEAPRAFQHPRSLMRDPRYGLRTHLMAPSCFFWKIS